MAHLDTDSPERRFEVRCRDRQGEEHVVGWTSAADGAPLVKLAHNDPEICEVTVIDTDRVGTTATPAFP